MQCMSFHHYLTTFTGPYNICVAIYNIVIYLSAVKDKIRALYLHLQHLLSVIFNSLKCDFPRVLCGKSCIDGAAITNYNAPILASNCIQIYNNFMNYYIHSALGNVNNDAETYTTFFFKTHRPPV